MSSIEGLRPWAVAREQGGWSRIERSPINTNPLPKEVEIPATTGTTPESLKQQPTDGTVFPVAARIGPRLGL